MATNWETGAGSARPTNDSMDAAIFASAGGVAIERPARPIQCSRSALAAPCVLLKSSIECARNVAGTGAVGAQLQPQVRVVADKGVHQLEGGAFLVVLACDIGVEADLVKTAARDDRQD